MFPVPPGPPSSTRQGQVQNHTTARTRGNQLYPLFGHLPRLGRQVLAALRQRSENRTTKADALRNCCIRRLRRHLVPYKCSQIGRSYLLHLFFRMIREAVGLSKAHLGADAFYCHRREVRQPTPCCMRPSKQVVPFIERHTCNKLGWDR